jgi:hypothetical protein
LFPNKKVEIGDLWQIGAQIFFPLPNFVVNFNERINVLGKLSVENR